MALERQQVTWLRRHVIEWAGAGLISDTQADAILDHEHVDEPTAPQRLTLVAEVASYLGSVIAFAGGAAIIGPNWDQLGLVGQAALALAIAAIGFTAGAWLTGQGEAGTDRLASFLWVVGTGGVALAVAGIANEMDPVDGAWFPTTIGIAVLTLGAALWRNLDRPLQLLTTGGGFLLAAGGIVALTDLSFWIAASGLWVLSFAFGTLAAARQVRPRLIALAIAATGLMIGSFLFMHESERFGAIAAVISAAIIVTYALYDRSWSLVALGVIAFLIANTALMSTVLQGTISRLIGVALGLVLVAAVAIRAQHTGYTRSRVGETSVGQRDNEPPDVADHSSGSTTTPETDQHAHSTS